MAWATGVKNPLNRVFRVLELDPSAGHVGRVFGLALATLIVLNVAAIVLESMPFVFERYGPLLEWFEIFSVAVFSIEYIIRLWTCTVVPEFRAPVIGRLRFALTPLAIVDLLAILPFYADVLGPFCCLLIYDSSGQFACSA